MAGQTFRMSGGGGVHVDGPDAYGSLTINGRLWHWEYHWYFGPTFLRIDGQPLQRQPGERHPVWAAFEKKRRLK